MGLERLATVIWRIIGGSFIIHGIMTAIVQFVAVGASFGQIMDTESLFVGTTLVGILLWPLIMIGSGLLIFYFSRVFARICTRGLDSTNTS